MVAYAVVSYGARADSNIVAAMPDGQGHGERALDIRWSTLAKQVSRLPQAQRPCAVTAFFPFVPPSLSLDS